MSSRISRALTFLGDLEATRDMSKDEHAIMCPAYCPWSQPEYMKRAASFHWTWASRPAPADIVTAARYGWQGISSSQDHECKIVCTACRARLVLPWSDNLLPEAAQTMAREYGALVTGNGHANSACPWIAVHPCAVAIELAQYASVPLEKELFRQRALSFSDIRINSPPPIQESHEAFLDENTALIDRIISILGKCASSGALLLAAMQWRVHQEMILCRFNCRSGIPLAAQDTVHPVEMHAWYCPFIRSGGVEGFLAIWERHPDKDSWLEDGQHPLLSRFTCKQVKDIIKGR